MAEPVIDLVRVAVAGCIVGVGVRVQAVGVRLDQHRSLARARVRDRLVEHGEHGHGVVAIDLLRGDAVTDSLVSQRRSGGLLGQRHADGVLVVLDEEHDRGLEHGREVERLVEVALTGGAVADERHRDGRAAPALLAVRESGGVNQLGCQRCALGRRPCRHRVVAAVAESTRHLEDLDRVEAAGHQGHRVAIGRECPVAFGQCQHRPNLASLLTARGRVDREATLLRQSRGLDVEPATDHHRPIGGQELLVGRLGIVVGDRLDPMTGVVEELHRDRSRYQAPREGSISGQCLLQRHAQVRRHGMDLQRVGGGNGPCPEVADDRSATSSSRYEHSVATYPANER